MSANDIPNRLGCPEFRRLLEIERRSFLKVGVLGNGQAGARRFVEARSVGRAGQITPHVGHHSMVIARGEFGRTPKVNTNAGRDHWPNVFSAAVAGGGIKGGRVVVASDDKGGEPAENPKTAQDVLATMYRHLGVNTKAQYEDHSGRPHPVLSSGNPIEELFL